MKNIVIISVVAIVVIILLMMRKQSTAAQTQSGLQGGGYYPPGQFIPTGGAGQVSGSDPIIDVIGDRILDCKGTCKNLCKSISIWKGRKKKCTNPCRSDCEKGVNVKEIYP